MKAENGTEPMHFECVVCQARATQQTAGEATETILVMMFANGMTIEDVVRDLCFVHRRAVTSAARRCLEEGGESA